MKCSKGHEAKYSERFDAHYCLECDEWGEPTCDDESCDYCKERPEKPSDLKDEDKEKMPNKEVNIDCETLHDIASVQPIDKDALNTIMKTQKSKLPEACEKCKREQCSLHCIHLEEYQQAKAK